MKTSLSSLNSGQQLTLSYVSADRPAESYTDLQDGGIIGQCYKVVGTLGAGGMSRVYEIENIPMQKRFALKVLRPQMSEVSLRRFQKEVRTVSALEHPNIVQVHGYGWLESGQPYMVLELLRGKTLHTKLREEGSLAIEAAIALSLEICLGLNSAHKAGIVHRDLKPSNIMLVEPKEGETNPKVKIIDFGLAKFIGQENLDATPLTESGAVFGTPLYMSPEQCLGEPVDSRTDVYALGCILFECLSGVPPFSGSSALQVMMKHQTGTPESLTEASLGKQFPVELQAIVMKALSKNPAQRYQSCAHLAYDLMKLNDRLGGDQKQSELPEAPVKYSGAKLWLSISVWLAATIIASTVFCNLPVIADLFHCSLVEAPKTKTYQATENSYFSRIKANSKEIEFPFDPSIASLYSSVGESENWQPVPPNHAVVLPANAVFALEIGWRFCRLHPALLRMFRSDEVRTLILKDKRFEREKFLPQSEFIFDDALLYANHFSKLKKFQANRVPLSDNGLRNLRLGDKKMLRELILDETRVSGKYVSALPVLPKLNKLVLSLCEDGYLVIDRLKDPTYLNLRGDNLSESDIEKLTDWKSLEKLDLRENPFVSDASCRFLAGLKSLKMLSLSGTSITLPGLERIFPLSKLKILDANLEIASHSEIESLRQRLPISCVLRQTASSVMAIMKHSLIEQSSKKEAAREKLE